MRVFAVCLVAGVGYMLVGSARPWLAHVAAPAATATPFTRLAPAVARQPTKTATATATAVPLLEFVPTVVPTLAPRPPATAVPPAATENAGTVAATPTEDAEVPTPTPTEQAPAATPTAMPPAGSTPGVQPTITPLVMSTPAPEPTPVPAPVTPEPSATPAASTFHTVAQGETVWSIAQKYQVRFEALLEANRDTIDNPEMIRVGMKLLIPTLGTGPPTQ